MHGVLNLQSDGNFSYTPDANYYGTDSFDFTVYDGQVYANGATVDFTIQSVNDLPVTVSDSYSMNQDLTTDLAIMNNDYDIDSTILTLTGIT